MTALVKVSDPGLQAYIDRFPDTNRILVDASMVDIPHAGTCGGTMCPDCGCCGHLTDYEAHCLEAKGRPCQDRLCECPAREAARGSL